MRRITAAARLAQERRIRENEAARLSQEVPHLKALRIAVIERRVGQTTSEVRYIRHIMVDNAPAIFEIPCSHRRCDEGGHDLTQRVLFALRNGEREFRGVHPCHGHHDGSACGREVVFHAVASYLDTPQRDMQGCEDGAKLTGSG